VSLFYGAEGIACGFNVILSELCTVMLQSQDCSSGIWWTVINVFLAGITDVCEDQVEDGCTNAWMRVADLFWPKVEDMVCPWQYAADNAEAVCESIELSSSGMKVSWVAEFSKVCSLGILKEHSCKDFNWRVSEVGSCR
jgi:hypothetical protein